nr:Na+/H+ antiporter NhaA [Ardenticatena sp.]
MNPHFQFDEEATTAMQSRFSPRITSIVRAFQDFAHQEASGGIVVLLATVVALLWANISPHTYEQFWHDIKVGISWGDNALKMSLGHWINDGLMVIFFFVVGLEIKREVTVGELRSIKRVTFPIAAAIGGMVMPALIYVAFNWGEPTLSGWGIPMATDIAFALGVLALLGSRIPTSLKIFLTTLAIADDMGAVLIIALFYTSNLSVTWLLLGLAAIGVALILNRLRFYRSWVYLLLGIVAWYGFLQSGVHATIAGVLMAFTIPVRRFLDRRTFLNNARRLLAEMEDAIENDDLFRSGIDTLEQLSENAQSPLRRLETTLHPVVAFFIVPVFALANAGVYIEGGVGDMLGSPLFLGIALGLALGKPVGIFLGAYLSSLLKLGQKPDAVSWAHILGAGMLGGIGFTVALFIATLGLPESALPVAKLSILTASFIAGVGGVIWLLLTCRPQSVPQLTAEEEEYQAMGEA